RPGKSLSALAVVAGPPPTAGAGANGLVGSPPTGGISSTVVEPAATAVATAFLPAVVAGPPPTAAPTVPVGLPVHGVAGRFPGPAVLRLVGAWSPGPASR